MTYAAAIYTGMRRGELAKVEVGDVDLVHCVIRVRGTKTVAAKRSIPIEPSLLPLIEMLLAEHEARVGQARQDGTPRRVRCSSTCRVRTGREAPPTS